MPKRLPPLNQLRTFEAAARHSSFTKAADEMHLTQSAISRQVKALEDYLGFELFVRTTTGVELTPQARHYGERLTKALEIIGIATSELTLKHSYSVITIRGFTSFFVRWLIPLLPDFERLHPNIKIRLIGSAEQADFQRDDMDFGVLYGKGDWLGLEADLLFNDELLPVCSAQLAQGQPPLSVTSDLSKHTLLHHNQLSRDWPEWLQAAGYPGLQSFGTRTFEDLSVAYECMLAGMGVIIGQRAYLEKELSNGTIAAPFETVLRRGSGFYMVCRKDKAGQEKVRAFRAWLSSVCDANQSQRRTSVQSSGMPAWFRQGAQEGTNEEHLATDDTFAQSNLWLARNTLM